jgi:hypothetical protein
VTEDARKRHLPSRKARLLPVCSRYFLRVHASGGSQNTFLKTMNAASKLGPTPKRNKGHAPVWVSGFAATLQGGSEELVLNPLHRSAGGSN